MFLWEYSHEHHPKGDEGSKTSRENRNHDVFATATLQDPIIPWQTLNWEAPSELSQVEARKLTLCTFPLLASPEKQTIPR
jgi:hypothetical protein